MKEKMEKLIESWKTIDGNIEVWESIDKEHFRTEEECKNHNDNFIEKYTMFQNFTVDEEKEFFDINLSITYPYDSNDKNSDINQYLVFLNIRKKSFQ